MIVHAGDEVNDVYLLKTGTITVEVPIPSYMNREARKKLLKYQNFEYNMETHKKKKAEKETIYLDWLNEGSCFCIYTAFTAEK